MDSLVMIHRGRVFVGLRFTGGHGERRWGHSGQVQILLLGFPLPVSLLRDVHFAITRGLPYKGLLERSFV